MILGKGKIVIINSVCGVGSTGRIVEDLYKAYTEQGFDTKVVYGRGNAVGVPAEDAFRFNSEFGFYVHALASRLLDRHGLADTSATKRIIAFLREFNPDIVHLHNIHGYYLNYRLLFEYLNSSQVKIVWTLHDCWSFTGHCAYFTALSCSKWQTQCSKCPGKRDYPTSWFADRSEKNFALKKKLFNGGNVILVTPSEWLKNEVKKSFLRALPVEVINNGIDTDAFRSCKEDIRGKYAIDPNKKIVLGVANYWTENKGFGSFMSLADSLPDDYRIVMVGLSEKQLKRLPSNVTGVTRTQSKEELAALYGAADVFFNPTKEDNYPTVNIESLCCGTPVVCFSETGGGAEIVGESGIVIDKRDVGSVLDAIDKCMKIKVDAELQRKKYSKKIYCDKYVRLIKSVLGENNGR